MPLNLQHLKALCQVVDRGLHLSQAADSLHRSQPAVTRQIQQLENALGVTVFERSRNRLLGLTPQGVRIEQLARRVVQGSTDLTRLAEDMRDETRGELTIATTHTQARYTLPQTIRRFMAAYPGVALGLRQGTPAQCCEMVAHGEADLAICAEGGRSDVVQLPCLRMQRIVVTPPRHPLLKVADLTLSDVARYPLITYAEGYSGRVAMDEAFRRAGLAPTVILRAIDADVSKTYVEMGMGIAILAAVTFDAKRDRGLRSMDAHHLFPASDLHVVLRPHSYLRGFTRAFIGMFAPALGDADMDRALDGVSPAKSTGAVA